jgi:hypothetical protein
VQIINLSDRLSGSTQTAAASVAASDEILECIVVRKSHETEFFHASRTLQQEYAVSQATSGFSDQLY